MLPQPCGALTAKLLRPYTKSGPTVSERAWVSDIHPTVGPFSGLSAFPETQKWWTRHGPCYLGSLLTYSGGVGSLVRASSLSGIAATVTHNGNGKITKVPVFPGCQRMRPHPLGVAMGSREIRHLLPP